MTNDSILERLHADDELQRSLFGVDLEIDPNAKEMAATLEGKIAEVDVFGFDRGHNFFGLWLKDGCARNDAPVVYADCHGGDQACVVADSLAEFLSIVLCMPTESGSSASLWVDTINNLRELPCGIAASYMAPSVDDDELTERLCAAASPEAALGMLFEYLRSKDGEVASRTADLESALAPLGIKRAEAPYAAVELARKKHGAFRLY